jgi:hypothetical protein
MTPVVVGIVIEGDGERPHIEAAAAQAAQHADEWLAEMLVGFLVDAVASLPNAPEEGALATDARMVPCGVEPHGDVAWQFAFRLEMDALTLYGPEVPS